MAFQAAPSSRDALSRYWPLFGLRLATPRLILRPVCDDDLAELVDLVLGGIHDPARMPFSMPWTDASREELIANTLRYFWRTRATGEPANWTVHFGVWLEGALIGTQELMGQDFAVTRVVSTGSWRSRVRQGQGLGTEMRAAVVDFAFDHLKATRAESSAFTDNPASLAVSAKLGYVADKSMIVQRRPGEAAEDRRLLLTPGAFRRPDWAVQVAGLDACRASFGL